MWGWGGWWEEGEGKETGSNPGSSFPHAVQVSTIEQPPAQGLYLYDVTAAVSYFLSS